MVEKKEPGLKMQRDLYKQLNDELHASDKERMKQKAEADEAKLQARRAKQEQVLAERSKKKQHLVTARASERAVNMACDDLEACISKMPNLKRAEDEVRALNNKRKNIKQRLRKLESELKTTEQQLATAQQRLNSVKEQPDIVTLKTARLKTLQTESDQAWDKVQKAVRKRERDRGTKRRAKDPRS